ncbi:MAG: iron-containing alcohol dehydrogenase family protein [Acetivibrionales bacterium]|jgi:alcohol dehydrogenase class IV
MNFKYSLKTKVIFEEGCVKKYKEEFGKYGKKCIIVTGRNSARKSGALEDVEKVLNGLGIEYLIFDKVENNPSLETVKQGGEEAFKFHADFVIGIGGGSPLDTAKAVAVLAVNRIAPLDLYKGEYDYMPLPILAIPTTAGTGSEVTQYSILTRPDMETKKSFASEWIFPKVAFLDARYTESMPHNVTVNTAIDAFSHAVEGYTSKRSTVFSDILAVQSIRLFGQCIDALIDGSVDFESREKLLYMSMLSGMVIAHTGTTIVHSLGYMLTYFKDIPHGKANGYFLAEYLKFNYEVAKDKIDNIISLLNLKDIDRLGTIMGKLIGKELKVTKEEIARYALIVSKQKSITNNLRTVDKNDLIHILNKVFL